MVYRFRPFYDNKLELTLFLVAVISRLAGLVETIGRGRKRSGPRFPAGIFRAVRRALRIPVIAARIAIITSGAVIGTRAIGPV
jgi:hypothetical protein